MKFNDRVYGEVEITEPVLLKLMKSKPVQRLKGINQAGPSKYVLPQKEVTRYEHSVGVMILLQRLGASVEEQIAGLLHDVPHTAFSHVADFVFRSEEHEFHEKFHEEIILNSEIPEILKEFGFDVDKILDEHNFPLLERDLPDLCADRVDYTLRDMPIMLGHNREKIDRYLKALVAVDGEVMFSDEEVAKEFAEDYLALDRLSWSSPIEVTIYHLMAKAIKTAMEKGILTEKELFEDDEYVYEKLKNSGNEEIQGILKLLRPGLKIKEDAEKCDFKDANKVRFIDPKINKRGVKRLTDYHPGFSLVIEKHVERTKKGYCIRIIQ